MTPKELDRIKRDVEQASEREAAKKPFAGITVTAPGWQRLPHRRRICLRCHGQFDQPESLAYGTFGGELLLWALAIIVAILTLLTLILPILVIAGACLVSIARQAFRRPVCPHCHWREYLPTDTPTGAVLAKEHPVFERVEENK